jgi:hypothetical protein
MRGGSQSFLVRGNDGLAYVAKFAGNPQGSRTLINEWLAGKLLQELGVSTPRLTVLTLNERLEGREELQFVVGAHKRRCEGHFHFGSQCPVDPETTAIYDFLPRPLLRSVVNIAQFATMLVFDKWMGQTDTRQSIFIRDTTAGGRIAFRTVFIDQGMCFGGDRWEFQDAPLYGRYMDASVYSMLDVSEHALNAISCVQRITEDKLYEIASTVPNEWFSPGDHGAFAHLLRRLEERRRILPMIIERCTSDLVRRSGTAA